MAVVLLKLIYLKILLSGLDSLTLSAKDALLFQGMLHHTLSRIPIFISF